MLLFGHIGVTLGILFILSYIEPRLKTIIDPRYLVVGALLPDLIDKPLGLIVFASTISNGRMISHTLVFSFTLFLIGLYLYDKRSDIRIISLASGSFFHLMEDQMWNTPKTLFWPLLGWSFPKNSIDYTGLEYLLVLFNRSFHPQFSESYTPEFLGMVVVVVLALYWLKNKLSETSFKNNKIKDENNEKPDTETAALYIIGSIIFGFFVVKAITTL